MNNIFILLFILFIIYQKQYLFLLILPFLFQKEGFSLEYSSLYDIPEEPADPTYTIIKEDIRWCNPTEKENPDDKDSPSLQKCPDGSDCPDCGSNFCACPYDIQPYFPKHSYIPEVKIQCNPNSFPYQFCPDGTQCPPCGNNKCDCPSNIDKVMRLEPYEIPF